MCKYCYSYFMDSVGFIPAIFNNCIVTVIIPIRNATPEATTKIHKIIAVLYGNEFNQFAKKCHESGIAISIAIPIHFRKPIFKILIISKRVAPIIFLIPISLVRASEICKTIESRLSIPSKIAIQAKFSRLLIIEIFFRKLPVIKIIYPEIFKRVVRKSIKEMCFHL